MASRPTVHEVMRRRVTERSFASVLVRTAVTSVGAIAVLVARRRKERRAAGGSADDLVSLDLRLRNGEVPQAPQERRAMRVLVAQRLHRTCHRRTGLVLLGVLFGGLTVLMALTRDARQSIGFGVLTVVFVGWMAYQGKVQDRRLRTMRAALGNNGPKGGPGSTRHGRDPRRPAADAAQDGQASAGSRRGFTAQAGQCAHGPTFDPGDVGEDRAGLGEALLIARFTGLRDQCRRVRPQAGRLAVQRVAGAQAAVEPFGALGDEVAVKVAEQGATGAGLLHQQGGRGQAPLRVTGALEPGAHQPAGLLDAAVTGVGGGRIQERVDAGGDVGNDLSVRVGQVPWRGEGEGAVPLLEEGQGAAAVGRSGIWRRARTDPGPSVSSGDRI